jgi:hypothetical protein
MNLLKFYQIALASAFTFVVIPKAGAQTCPIATTNTIFTGTCETGITWIGGNLTLGTTTSGSVTATSLSGDAISASGELGTLNNTSNSTISSIKTGILNGPSGNIQSLINSGFITGTESGLWSYGTVNRITNNLGATISSTGSESGFPGIYLESGSVGTISNYGTISSNSYVGLYSLNATVDRIENNGIISGRLGGLTSNVRIGELVNNNLITSLSNGIEFGGDSFVDSFKNFGTIYAPWGLTNSGTIVNLTNVGSMTSDSGSGNLYNNLGQGVITTFNNLQGGNASSPLTTAINYSGILPVNYNIIVRSLSNYGQLAVTFPSGSTNFAIYGGGVEGVSASTLTKGTYNSVFSGITISNLNNTSGSFNGFRWSLVNSSSDIWDLIVTGASTVDTQQSIANTATALTSTFALENAVMVNSLTIDCSVFDMNGICVNAGRRHSSTHSKELNNASGIIIASYRLNQNNSRIGAWIDQNLSVSGSSIVKLGNSIPMIGLFGLWRQAPDGLGVEVKGSAAYAPKDMTITRQAFGTSELGSGGSQLISQGAQMTAKYGFSVMPELIVSPYMGLRYTQNKMKGYTESASVSVTAPLTYSALNTNATTLLAGVGISYRLMPKAILFASTGLETDTGAYNGTYSATGIDGISPLNFNPNPRKNRVTATLGANFEFAKNQQLDITAIYRQEAYQAVSTTTVFARFAVGF